MANPPIIADLPHAVLRSYGNELALDQKGDAQAHPTWDDPVKLRLGAFPPDRPGGFYVGAIGMDVLSGDTDNPRRLEKGFIALKMDPDPTLELYLQRTKDSEDDASMMRVLRITARGIEFMVPTNTGGGGGEGLHADGTVAFSGDGGYWFVMQNDGNLVVYRCRAPFDKQGATPVWDRHNGDLR